jgi:NAD(P)H-dependent flavin oxidoreductase YrpB (nitropropane dioxygenase family)|eukprot:SAG25_NODE_339_length_9497_cov_2.975109_2_plen_182_part_00
MVLIPQCVDMCKGHRSPLHGGDVLVIGAGGIFDGRGMAAAMALGAAGVWVGTRFVAAAEASAGPRHQQAVIQAGSDDTIRTTIFSGRPMRVMKNDYILEWEQTRQQERDALLASGKRPYKTDLERCKEEGNPLDLFATYPNILGQASGGITEVLPARTIVHNMVTEAFDVMVAQAGLLSRL